MSRGGTGAEGPHVPTRTCVGCRQRGERAQLRRYVAVEGRLVDDVAKSAPGRGAWLHDEPACWERAVVRKAFPRALRCRVDVEPGTPQLGAA